MGKDSIGGIVLSAYKEHKLLSAGNLSLYELMVSLLSRAVTQMTIQ